MGQTWASPTLVWLHCAHVYTWLLVWTNHLAKVLTFKYFKETECPWQHKLQLNHVKGYCQTNYCGCNFHFIWFCFAVSSYHISNAVRYKWAQGTYHHISAHANLQLLWTQLPFCFISLFSFIFWFTTTLKQCRDGWGTHTLYNMHIIFSSLWCHMMRIYLVLHCVEPSLWEPDWWTVSGDWEDNQPQHPEHPEHTGERWRYYCGQNWPSNISW